MKQPRSKNLSALGKYLWNNRISDIEFAKTLRSHLKVEHFSSSTVENWRYGKSQPKGENLSAVKALTGMTLEQILEIE